MLELVDIHTYYGDSYVLQGVSLEVKKGSVAALLGRNGMGKTTTLHSIMGFAPPRRGTIRFQGHDLTGLSSNKIARLGLGFVPQGRRIFQSLSVEENLTMAARSSGGESSPWSLKQVYDFFPVLRDRSGMRGTLLSGGEQSILNIARALMTNPGLILMDEPSEGLAPIMVVTVAKIVGQLKEKGLSILLVEQNLPLALRLSDYIYIMGKGVIVCETVNENYKETESMVASYICVSG
jgi:branched-chain amino acid transport system ATP-binding protein